MRQIKFRLWEKKHKKFWTWGFIREKIKIIFGGVPAFVPLIPLKEPQNLLQQFTGLYDNTKWKQLIKPEQQKWLDDGKTKEEWKGKEIYEGDIVKWYNGKEEVKYDEESGKFCFGIYAMNEQEIRVVGNVYENPKLLKKVKK